jgi:hypothetical protein
MTSMHVIVDWCIKKCNNYCGNGSGSEYQTNFKHDFK